jgi:hypothetical protein
MIFNKESTQFNAGQINPNLFLSYKLPRKSLKKELVGNQSDFTVIAG